MTGVEYNQAKDLRSDTCLCCRCWIRIRWSSGVCVGYGLYACSGCVSDDPEVMHERFPTGLPAPDQLLTTV
jgi:hypothetical protein